MAENKLIQVALIDDHFEIHKIVRSILDATADIKLVAEGANGQEALELCQHFKPDVVLMDVVMPIMDGIQATQLLHERLPAIKVLVLSSFQDHESVYAMLEHGAVGYLTKGALTHELANTIRVTFQGSTVFSQEVATYLSAPRSQPAKNFHLTDRELEVLILMADGLTMPAMAAKLVISQSTVKFHMENILRKLGVGTRSEALIVAAKNNLV